MDRNLNSSEEQKPEPISRAYLTRDILVIGEDGSINLVKAGILPDARIVFTDQDGKVVYEDSLWTITCK